MSSRTLRRIADPLELFTDHDEGSGGTVAAPAATAPVASDTSREEQVATRGQELRTAAAAAGATRSGNEQDWLGGGKPKVRRKDAAQVLLGR